MIRKALHPAVSKMNRKRCVEYIYGTSAEILIYWSKYLERRTQKSKIPKRCLASEGQTGEKYRKIGHIKKAPSDYNEFMRQKLSDKSWLPNVEYGGKSGRFARAAHLWKQHKAEFLEKKYKTVPPALKNKIPKKKKTVDMDSMSEARRNAMFTSMGLPASFS